MDMRAISRANPALFRKARKDYPAFSEAMFASYERGVVLIGAHGASISLHALLMLLEFEDSASC